MKITLGNIVTALVCVALICAAVCIGAVRGWSSERDAALTVLTAEGDMRTQLEYRGMDAANLAVVAARHLPADDADLTALQEASRTLLSGTEDVPRILEADAAITEAALRLSESLPQLSTVQASERDRAYIAMLTSSLGKKSSLTHAYALLVDDYNQRLTTSLTGKLAMLLGVDPLPVTLEQ